MVKLKQGLTWLRIPGLLRVGIDLRVLRLLDFFYFGHLHLWEGHIITIQLLSDILNVAQE